MESIRAWRVILCFFYSFLSAYGNGNGSSNLSRDSLDDLIRDYAFKELERSHTGVLNTVPVPANFSGVAASVARIRSSTFWSRGASFSDFYIPPEIAMSKHEHWSSLAPLSLEVVISASQKAKDDSWNQG